MLGQMPKLGCSSPCDETVSAWRETSFATQLFILYLLFDTVIRPTVQQLGDGSPFVAVHVMSLSERKGGWRTTE